MNGLRRHIILILIPYLLMEMRNLEQQQVPVPAPAPVQAPVPLKQPVLVHLPTQPVQVHIPHLPAVVLRAVVLPVPKQPVQVHLHIQQVPAVHLPRLPVPVLRLVQLAVVLHLPALVVLPAKPPLVQAVLRQPVRVQALVPLKQQVPVQVPAVPVQSQPPQR